MIAKNYKAYQEQVQTCPIFKLDIQQFSENSFKDTTVPSISFPLEQYSFPFGHKYVYFQPGKHFTQVLKHAYELNSRSIFQKEKKLHVLRQGTNFSSGNSAVYNSALTSYTRLKNSTSFNTKLPLMKTLKNLNSTIFIFVKLKFNRAYDNIAKTWHSHF